MSELTYCDVTGSTHGSVKWTHESKCLCQACYRYGNRPKGSEAALVLRNGVLEDRVKALILALESFRSRGHSKRCLVHRDRECGLCDCGHDDINSRIDAAIKETS